MVEWLTEGDFAGANSTDGSKSVKLFLYCQLLANWELSTTYGDQAPSVHANINLLCSTTIMI